MDEIERGEKTEFNSINEMATFIDELGEEAAAKFKAKRRRG